jgi:glyoxylase-like metal-dependent hydrolase (beta-lactamase superfamily II)
MEGKMWPIKSELKAKRIKWGTAQGQLSWAYMKELRENNKTKKIYPVNPYIEVYQFRDNMYGLFNQNCDGGGDVWMFLIVGPEKALLIDTAYGLGDMKGLVDEITGGKPVFVVNTHHHFDHAYGNCRFEKVFCHEYLVPYLEKQSSKMWDYLFDKEGKCIWLDFNREDLPTFKKYEIAGIPDGYTFNLGNDYEVELIWTAGHVGGHAMYLDKKDRVLFAGDDICSNESGIGNGPKRGYDPYGCYSNISTFRDNLSKLIKRMNEFDYIFPSHFMVNLENNLLSSILETCDEIIANPDDYDYKVDYVSGNGGPSKTRMQKIVKGWSTISYSASGVYPPDL